MKKNQPGLQSKVCLSCDSGTLISSTEVTESWEWSKTSSKFFEPDDPGDLDLFDFTVSVKLDRGQNSYDGKSDEDEEQTGRREENVGEEEERVKWRK